MTPQLRNSGDESEQAFLVILPRSLAGSNWLGREESSNTVRVSTTVPGLGTSLYSSCFPSLGNLLSSGDKRDFISSRIVIKVLSLYTSWRRKQKHGICNFKVKQISRVLRVGKSFEGKNKNKNPNQIQPKNIHHNVFSAQYHMAGTSRYL